MNAVRKNDDRQQNGSLRLSLWKENISHCGRIRDVGLDHLLMGLAPLTSGCVLSPYPPYDTLGQKLLRLQRNFLSANSGNYGALLLAAATASSQAILLYRVLRKYMAKPQNRINPCRIKKGIALNLPYCIAFHECMKGYRTSR